MNRLFLAVLIMLIFPATAQALTIDGGTAAQQAYAREVLDASRLDVGWLDRQYQGGIAVHLADHWTGYWELPPDVEVFMDVLPGAVGLAYSSGDIVIKSSYAPGLNSFFGEIVAHETTHLDWFKLPGAARSQFIAMVTAGLTPDTNDWYQRPAEAYAEQGKVAFWSPDYTQVDRVRTRLRLIPADDFYTWRGQWPGLEGTEPITTTTTIIVSTTLPRTTPGKYKPPAGWGYTPPATTTTVPTTSTTVPQPGTTTTTVSRRIQPPARWSK